MEINWKNIKNKKKKAAGVVVLENNILFLWGPLLY